MPSPEGEPSARARPLAGRRILVTRRAEQGGELSRRLEDYGAEVIAVPLIRIEPPTDPGAAAAAIDAVATYDYVVFTSVNAVAAVKTLAADRGIDLTTPGPTVIAVGPATGEALDAIGLTSETEPDDFSSAGIARSVQSRQLSGRRVLLPRSEIGRDDLPAALRRLGAMVDDIAFYMTAPDPAAAAQLVRALPGLDVITFASGSAVAAFPGATPAGWERPAELVVAVIGSATASAARLAGLDPDIMAEEHTAAGLAGAIAAYFERR